jgi:hypothetical protein
MLRDTEERFYVSVVPATIRERMGDVLEINHLNRWVVVEESKT